MDTRKNLISCKRVAISCVVPVCNEQAVIANFLAALIEKLEKLTNYYEVIVVNDGSQDQTNDIVKTFCKNHKIKLINFSRNFGKENALTAGLAHCQGDVTILMDCDFQHPLALLDVFLEKWGEGYEMVYGLRTNRDNETFLKKLFAKIFYRTLQLITKTNIPPHAGDFRLLDKKIVAALNALEERSRFMKGLYAWVGYSAIAVPFIVPDRQAGKSAWRLGKLTELAITGITAFSDVPLRIWGVIGLIISTIAFLYGLIIVCKTLLYGIDVPGYATIITAIMFFGGVQLLSIGILGEYIGRIFQEVKKRPNYIIAEKIGFDEPNKH